MNLFLKRLEKIEKSIPKRGVLLRWVDCNNVSHQTSVNAFLRLTAEYPIDITKPPATIEKCPVKEFDFSQLKPLPVAQQLFICNLLEWWGFPAMEEVERKDGCKVYSAKSGNVVYDCDKHTTEK